MASCSCEPLTNKQTTAASFSLSIWQDWVCSLLILFGIYFTGVQNPDPRPHVRCLTLLEQTCAWQPNALTASQWLTMAWCNSSKNLNSSKTNQHRRKFIISVQVGKWDTAKARQGLYSCMSASQVPWVQLSPQDHRQLIVQHCLFTLVSTLRRHTFSWHRTTDPQSHCVTMQSKGWGCHDGETWGDQARFFAVANIHGERYRKPRGH